ncbi:MAG: cobyric acid synthase, partial [Desulfofustis sp.]|nr:cobyric acid synthase [Desulfofustis sp.]
TLFIIDEAFHDFVSSATSVGGRLDNIITLNSLTKFFAIPGLLAGFGIFPVPFARKMKRILPPWTMNALAERVVQKGLQDRDYCRKSIETCQHLKDELITSLQKIPQITLFHSAANYLLLRVANKEGGHGLYEKLLAEGIIIRRCANFVGLDSSYFRIAVRTGEENRELLKKMRLALSVGPKASTKSKKKAKSLMFQGTSSNAGKSILAAAFCRILVQDGFKVAPFKAQNMSLNSHVTADGSEMGRAQAVQAVAARVAPDYRMNPVLLKPNSDTGSQVILNGKPVGNMDVRQYHFYKEQAWKAVTASYDALVGDFDVVVLEGAGSPGEINLKKHDIVNMRMARYAESPVLVVGDIDRGGVYASFAGTMDVLEEWERRLIAGFVVNKFRGDAGLLHEAHLFIKEHTGRDVLAVVPYITEMRIPQEDSVSLREGFYGDRYTGSGEVEIAVIDLPHISNFTDIDPLRHEPDVNVRFVKELSALGSPDAIILPGSKNVAGDLAEIRGRGFEPALKDYADRGGTIVGICGGYQMLGRELKDPHGLETMHDSVSGFNLIRVDTVLAAEKTLVKRTGIHIDSGCDVQG